MMISRALQAGMLFAWFTADGAYGQAKRLRAWLEEHDVPFVMAIRRSDTVTTEAGEQRATLQHVRVINAATGELIRELTINPARNY
jgi:SRSO17 transposase